MITEAYKPSPGEEPQLSANPEARNATFGRRLGATLVDFIVLIFASLILTIVFGLALKSSISDEEMLSYVNQGLTNVLLAIATMWLESSKWQGTPGKMLLNLKVENGHGARISFGTAFFRYVAKIPAALVLLLGYFAMLWHKDRLTWYDSWTNTRVRHYPEQG